MTVQMRENLESDVKSSLTWELQLAYTTLWPVENTANW